MSEEELQLAKMIKEKGIMETQWLTGVSFSRLLNILDKASILIYNPKESKKGRKDYRRILKDCLFQYKIQNPKIGVLSDTHIGNRKMNLEYVKRAYEKFNQENILEVLHTGDLLEGYRKCLNTKEEETLKSICEEQIALLTAMWPKDFKTYVVFGNHEENFRNLNLDLLQIVPHLREDIVPLGFGAGYIKWNEWEIGLKHKIFDKEKLLPVYLMDCYFYLEGHSHFYQYIKDSKTIKVPTCSDNQPNDFIEDRGQPGFLILKQEEQVEIERYIFEKNKIVKILTRTLNNYNSTKKEK